SVPAHASQRFQLVGPDAQTTGAIRIFPQTGVTPSAVCIFSFMRNGVRVTEATVPDISANSAFRVYGERSGAVRSGLAVTNTSSAPVDVTVEVVDLGGVSLLPVTTLHLDGMGHVSAFFDQLLPITGPHLFRISAGASSIPVVGLKSRYNERGD